MRFVVPLALMLSLAACPARAAEPPSGDEVARRLVARDDGAAVSRRLEMELIGKGGRTRTRATRSFRLDRDGARRAVLFFETPKTVRGTAFLTYDYETADRTDDQWLYLPAVRRSRRISTSDRGRSFLGTDFSYEDLKKETKLDLADYRFAVLGEEQVDGHRCWLLEATPVDADTADELGYGRMLMRVDAELWLPRLVEYWTPGGQRLKTARLDQIRRVQGIWTPHLVEVQNHRSGHATRFRFSEVDYETEVPEDLFTERALRRGPP